MGEPRKTQVVLPDNQCLDILVQKKQSSLQLKKWVCLCINVKNDVKYFDLAYKHESDQYLHWLSPEKNILEHDLPKSEIIQLLFLMRVFAPCISCLRDDCSIRLLYAQTRDLVASGQITVDSKTVFKLAALVMQQQHGDYESDPVAKSYLKKLSLIPVSTLKEHPSLDFCESEIMREYKLLKGISSGTALVRWMLTAQDLSSYGVHLYEVKDKSGIPWWLGVSLTGISVFDINDRTNPRKTFQWKEIQRIFYRERKFFVQLRESSSSVMDSTRRLSISSDLRTGWTVDCAVQTSDVWSMAISHYEIYKQLLLEDRHERRNLLDIADKLSTLSPSIKRCVSLQFAASTSAPDLFRSASLSKDMSALSSRNNLKALSSFEGNGSSVSLAAYARSRSATLSQNEDDLRMANYRERLSLSELSRQNSQKQHMLQEKRKRLESILNRKLILLQSLCIKEFKITGVLPVEKLLSDGVKPQKTWYKGLRPTYHQSVSSALKHPSDKTDSPHIGRLLKESVIASRTSDNNNNNNNKRSSVVVVAVRSRDSTDSDSLRCLSSQLSSGDVFDSDLTDESINVSQLETSRALSPTSVSGNLNQSRNFSKFSLPKSRTTSSLTRELSYTTGSVSSLNSQTSSSSTSSRPVSSVPTSPSCCSFEISDNFSPTITPPRCQHAEGQPLTSLPLSVLGDEVFSRRSAVEQPAHAQCDELFSRRSTVEQPAHAQCDSSVQRFETHIEVSKSFQMSDFLKYSQKKKSNADVVDSVIYKSS